MPFAAHPGRLLRRELRARELSANRLALDLGVPSGRITDILNGRRSISADTAVRLSRYFGNTAQFWLDLQGQYDIAVVEREKGAEIAKRVRPADAASVQGVVCSPHERSDMRGHKEYPDIAALIRATLAG